LSQPVTRNNTVVAGAIVAGCGFIALALYLRPAAAPAPATTTGLRPLGAADAAPGEPSAKPSDPPLPPSQVHTAARFRDLWQPVAHQADAKCSPKQLLGARDDTRRLELGMLLSVEADGRVREAKPTKEARDVADDGTYRKPKGTGVPQAAECYAKQIVELVKFPPATSGSEVTVEVPLLDTSAP